MSIRLMSIRRLVTTLALAAGASSVQAALIAINFDDLAANVSVGSAYSGLGVTFSNATTGNIILGGSSSPNIIFGSNCGSICGPSSPISAVFSTAASTVSIRGIDVGAAGIKMTAYDAAVGGAVLDIDTFFGTGLGIGAFHDLTVTGSGIMRVEFSQATPCCGDGTLFDNFSFDTASSVPEPGTLALFGLAMVGAGFGSRRRHA